MKPTKFNRFRITLALLIFTLATGLLAPLSRAGRSEGVEPIAQDRTTQKATFQPSDDSGTFNNFQPINIPDSGPASLYPSPINVSGLEGVTSRVTVRLNLLTHPNPDDLDILLESPTGQTFKIMSDAGGSNPLNNVNITFTEFFALRLPDEGQIISTAYIPANYGGDTDTFPASAPPPPYGDPVRFETLETAFNGQDPNGMWKLWVVDDTPGGSGMIATGWGMTIQTVTYEVTNLNPDGPGSLVQAIADAPPGGRVDIDPNLTGTITLTDSITIDKAITINGPGQDKLTISGNGSIIPFIIESSGLIGVNMRDLTIANGRSFGEGGGIINEGTLNLTNVTITDCIAGEQGGGIANSGNLFLANVTFKDNDAGTGGGGFSNSGQGSFTAIGCKFTRNRGGGHISNNTTSPVEQVIDRCTFFGGSSNSRGGAIENSGGTLRIIKCTINSSSAFSDGGGLYNGNGAVTTVINSTFYNCTAQTNGGAVYNEPGGTLNLFSCTLTRNTATLGNGGGLYQQPGDLTFISIKNVISADNTSGFLTHDIFGLFNSQGGNLIGDATGGIITSQTGDNFGTSGDPINPLLTSLGDYGGDTPTCMLKPGSPANNTGVSPSNRNNEDQRGLFAPQGAGEDKGSTERRPRAPSSIELFDARFFNPNEVHVFARLQEDSPAAFPLNGLRVGITYQGDRKNVFTDDLGIARGIFPVFADGQPQSINAEFSGSVFHNPSFAGTFLASILFPTPDSAAPGGDNCQFLIFDADGSFAANGGAGTINVRTFPQTCNWTATSNDPWIQITSGSNGTGDGSVSYTVSSHTGTAPRAGSITVAGITYDVLQGAAFSDVPVSHPFYSFIGKLSARGVTLGCDSGLYCPDDVVTRQQMAAFIIRALGDFNPPEPAMQRFTDVPPDNPFYRFIDQMAIRQITLGCAANLYCPLDVVTRQQMAAFLIRALGEPNPTEPFEQRFTDVPLTNFFSPFIEEMAIRRITLGCTANMYCPDDSVTRGQMAAFLVRAFGL